MRCSNLIQRLFGGKLLCLKSCPPVTSICELCFVLFMCVVCLRRCTTGSYTTNKPRVSVQHLASLKSNLHNPTKRSHTAGYLLDKPTLDFHEMVTWKKSRDFSIWQISKGVNKYLIQLRVSSCQIQEIHQEKKESVCVYIKQYCFVIRSLKISAALHLYIYF